MTNQVMLSSALLVTLMLSTLTQLEDLAQASSDKAVAYADDATNAIDCAFQARPLDECSPNLFSTDFSAETAQTQAILEDLKAQQPGAHLQRG